MTRAWPTREAWATSRRTVYADDVDKVRAGVSDLALDFATPAEIDASVAELRAHWTSLGHGVREANTLARIVFPKFDQGRYAATSAGLVDWLAAWDALPEADRAAVEVASRLRDERRELRDLIDRLESGFLLPLGRLAGLIPNDRCSTFDDVHARWRQARAVAVEAFIRRIEVAPVDDEAWAKELRRRQRIERGPVVYAHHTNKIADEETA